MCDHILVLLFNHWSNTRLTLRLTVEEHELLSFEVHLQRGHARRWITAVKAGNHMQRIRALVVAAQACDHHVPHISPGALVDRLMDVHVLRFVSAVSRPVGRKAHSLGCCATRGLHLPAVFREADGDLLPELGVFVFVVSVQVVDIEAADVAQDLLRTLVTPVSL